MGNCSRRLIGGGRRKEATVLTANCTSGNAPHQERQLSAVAEVFVGNHDGGGPSTQKQKTEYFSPRVEEMTQSKSQFSSAVEHEIAHSRVHWSEVTRSSQFLSEISEVTRSSQFLSEIPEDTEEGEDEDVKQENEQVFAELLNDPQWGQGHPFGHFFKKLPWSLDSMLGERIAEGSQGTIYECVDPHGSGETNGVLKVFKRGSRLSDMRKQWPCGILRREVKCVLLLGTMFDDGRFAFMMPRFWGDLRKLIDQAMQAKNNQGPPFPYELNGHTWEAKPLMLAIARDVGFLNEKGIVHRDLKASNILLNANPSEKNEIFIADFECSVGVLGSGFWRPPELLLALKNGSASKFEFSKKSDVYSYAMTCFEIITGRLPFEELYPCRASNDLIIDGLQPTLPSDLDERLKNLIQRCWNSSPCERPFFFEICIALQPEDGVSETLHSLL